MADVLTAFALIFVLGPLVGFAVGAVGGWLVGRVKVGHGVSQDVGRCGRDDASRGRRCVGRSHA